METEVVVPGTPRRRQKSPLPITRGMTILPFGLVLGFTATAMSRYGRATTVYI